MTQTGSLVTTAFKAYDIRGRVPSELNPDLAWAVGQAYARFLQPQRVVLGRDIRASSEALTQALGDGLRAAGCDVYDLGLCGTEEVYFAVFHHGMDGGIMVTASHNPGDYNGMKLVREDSRPISGDTGLHSIRDDLVGRCPAPAAPTNSERKIGGLHSLRESRAAYVQHLLSYLEPGALKPLKIVMNPGNGCAGPTLDALLPHLPLQVIKMHWLPDATFPHGIPNPLLPENRAATATAVREHGADLGIAWDGDFDRCFLFDEQGTFLEGYYIVGLLADYFLRRFPGAKIVHDPRLTWNTIDIVAASGGQAVQSKTGHAFIKERMRLEDAVYGGEMSAHHYFRDFAYCDSGMLPWLLVAQLMSRKNVPLSHLVAERMALFPASGEINRKVTDVTAVLHSIGEEYAAQALSVDHTDGLSLEFADWRFNLRGSNTEPVLRLNVESRGDVALLQHQTECLLKRIAALA